MAGDRSSNANAIKTVPNILTLLRLVMAVVAAVLFLVGRFEAAAVGLCLIGLLLDAVDGWVARRFSQCTQLGRYMDPLADKVITTVIFGVIAIRMNSPIIWVLFVLVIGRDLVVTISRSRDLRRYGAAVPADRLGKIKMIIQSAGGGGILVYAHVLGYGFSFSPYPVVAVLVIVTILSYVSAGRYLMWGNPVLIPGVKRGR